MAPFHWHFHVLVIVITDTLVLNLVQNHCHTHLSIHLVFFFLQSYFSETVCICVGALDAFSGRQAGISLSRAPAFTIFTISIISAFCKLCED